ncbi:MAG: 4-(cytidine 5'-diphospho)-2-C-methyl-D-erythritol kinase, partial [Alphaproteobacteria bacterium]
ELADAHAVLINPGVALATGDVFAALDESPGPASAVARLVPPVSGIEDLIGQLLARGNDLERIAIVLVPEIRVALQALSELPGCLLARMSGSGATCYGLFAQAAEAAAGAAFLRHAYDDWWVRETAFRRVGAQEPDGAAS